MARPGPGDPVLRGARASTCPPWCPSIAGPKRPQDRIALADAKNAFRDALPNYVPETNLDNGLAGTFPASDPVAAGDGTRASNPVQVTLEDGTTTSVDHGAVVIAAITSCTNTSNPSVMIGAALLAKKAVERGLSRKPWVKTSLAPGSKVVMDYYERAGLLPYLDKLGFNLVGYGCTTCIGNSGPLPPEISQAVNDNDLAVTAVLSGNRNFEGRINPDVKMNYLASPPLVVAYALAGTMDIDLDHDPLGSDSEGKPVYLADIWPSPEEVADVVQHAVAEEMFTRDYADVFTGDDNWRGLDVPAGDTFAWEQTRPTCAARRTSTGCRPSRSRSPTSPARGHWPCWATRSPPTTSPRRARSGPTARRDSTSPSTASSGGTSTPTARGAATTR